LSAAAAVDQRVQDELRATPDGSIMAESVMLQYAGNPDTACPHAGTPPIKVFGKFHHSRVAWPREPGNWSTWQLAQATRPNGPTRATPLAEQLGLRRKFCAIGNVPRN